MDRLLILDPGSAQEVRDRGLLNLKMECLPQALEDLEACLRASHRQAYIRLAPYADDAAEIREQTISLKKRRAQIH